MSLRPARSPVMPKMIIVAGSGIATTSSPSRNGLLETGSFTIKPLSHGEVRVVQLLILLDLCLSSQDSFAPVSTVCHYWRSGLLGNKLGKSTLFLAFLG